MSVDALPQHSDAHPIVRAVLFSRSGRIGAALGAAVVLLATLGPLVAPYGPTEVIAAPFQPPSAEHLLGTDMLGRDGLSRVLSGGGTLILVALLSTALAYVAGVPLGLLMGYRGGRLDLAVGSLVDVLVAFPPVIFVLLLVAGLGASLPVVILAIAALHAPRVVRITRAVSAALAVQDYVEAAVLRGERTSAILVHELLANAWTPILADFGIRVAGSVILFASLSYLGFGLAPPAADWGLMVSENRFAIFAQPWVVLVPTLLIAFLTVGLSLVADAVAREVGVAAELSR
jgi:peptide/nickel transport system permease protein